MAYAVYLMYQVDTGNLVRNKINICREYHIQPSEIDRLPYYEYETYIEEIQEIQKREEEQRKQNENGNSSSTIYSAPDYGRMMRDFKLPAIKPPKF